MWDISFYIFLHGCKAWTILDMQTADVYSFSGRITSGRAGEQMLVLLPQAAAGLSLDGGYILSGIALDPETLLLNAPRPECCWSAACCAT